jgi:CBS domain-containing protein
MAEPPAAPRTTPSNSLLGNLRAQLMQRVPFAQMSGAHVEQFLSSATQAYFAPGEVVIEPASGVATDLLCIRQGSVSGRHGMAEVAGQFEYVAGDLFPIGAVLGARAVTATYTANEDTFCLLLPAAAVQALAAVSAPFADFLNRRLMHLLALSQRAVQSNWASQALAEQSLEARLDSLPRKQPLTCLAGTPLAQALAQMHERRVGSVLVVDEAQAPIGILTRHDILGRVTLPQCALDAPIATAMSAPIHTLDSARTLQDAALLMSRHGVRHVPVTEAGRLVNIVSERDLFALQRLSLKQISTQVRAAQDLASLQHLAEQIRRFARNLLGQGVQARQLTELVSHLNDLLTERLLQLVMARHGLDAGRACWLAFGSEGRGEQTVATDQDNGLIFVSDAPDADRPRWLAMASEVNAGLDACGYPLCKGQVMASNPACCLTQDEWRHRFAHWVEHGAPEDLLNASIYFDLRPVFGHAQLARPLLDMLQGQLARVPRFLKQMADNALRSRPPLNWRGALETKADEGRALLDLKLSGTAMFVDAARLFKLAQGVAAHSTRARFEAAATPMGVTAQESEAWIAAFEFLQMLRLQVQIGRVGGPAASDANPNLIDTAALNAIDLHMLKETMRVARRLQQRIELDYPR